MDDVEGLIGELTAEATDIRSNALNAGPPLLAEKLCELDDLLTRAASALTRLQDAEKERDDWARLAEQSPSSWLAREKAEAERDAAISQRDAARRGLEQAAMELVEAARITSQHFPACAKLFLTASERARSLLSEDSALVSSAATGIPSPLPPGAEGP